MEKCESCKEFNIVPKDTRKFRNEDRPVLEKPIELECPRMVFFYCIVHLLVLCPYSLYDSDYCSHLTVRGI